RGDHPPLERPSDRPAVWGRGGFVAGIDVAGADEEDPEGLLAGRNPRRDSTVVTVAFAADCVVGVLGVRCREVVLRQAQDEQRRRGYVFRGGASGGRVRAYGVGLGSWVWGVGGGGEPNDGSGAPDDLVWELLRQAGEARYELGGGQVLRWGVPERLGHDDLLNA